MLDEDPDRHDFTRAIHVKNAMKSSKAQQLPPYLEICVRKGLLDERTARRIELHRRTRGLGMEEAPFTLLAGPPDPHLTFENFVTCKGNSFALEVAGKIASQSPERLPYNPVYFYGDVGLGKTHLLSAIANQATEKLSFLVNAADLEIEMTNACGTNSRADLRRWLSSAEILLLDDIQLCEGREDLQREVFAVLNHLIREHRWVVISSDVPPTRLAGIEKRLSSRLQGGVIIGLQMGDREERIAAVNHFLDGCPITSGVVEYLADRETESMRRLRAIVLQLAAAAQSAGGPVTVEMVKSLVAGYDHTTRPQPKASSAPMPEEALDSPYETADSWADPESCRPRTGPQENGLHDEDSCVAEAVAKLMLLDHVRAAAAVHDRRLIVAKGSKLPGRQVGYMAGEAARFFSQSDAAYPVGSAAIMTLVFSKGLTVIALQRSRTTYVVILSKKGKPALCLPDIQDLLSAQGYRK